MIKHSEKYEEMTNGGKGNGFSTKEILIEHMKEQKKVNNFVMKQFLEGTNKIGKHTASLYYMKWIIGLIIAGMSYLYTKA